LFLGDMGSIQRELRPSTQREDQLTMETKLEQIAVKAVNQLPKSVVREIRTPVLWEPGGGRPPPATRWARRNPVPTATMPHHMSHGLSVFQWGDPQSSTGQSREAVKVVKAIPRMIIEQFRVVNVARPLGSGRSPNEIKISPNSCR
jgi:hypothetical protein